MELKCKVMGLISERKRERELLLASPIDKPETAVLIAICNMDIHQYDSSNFSVPHVSSGLAN